MKPTTVSTTVHKTRPNDLKYRGGHGQEVLHVGALSPGKLLELFYRVTLEMDRRGISRFDKQVAKLNAKVSRRVRKDVTAK